MPREMQKPSFVTSFKGMDYMLLIPVVLLCALGVVFIASGTIDREGYATIIKHAMWLGISTLALIVGMAVDHSVWRKYYFPMLIFGFVLLVVVFFFPAINNAHRWIRIGSLTIQSTEIVKFILCTYVAKSLSSFKKMNELAKPAIWLLPFFALIYKEPNHSMVVILCGMIGVGVIVANFPMKILALGFAAAIFAGAIYGLSGIVFKSDDFHTGRIQSYLNPEENPEKAHQTIQTKIAIGSGGFWGKGIGNGSQKRGFVPIHELHTDSMFSLVAEEGGFKIAALVMVAFVFIMWRGYHIALKANTKYATLLAVGLTSLIMLNMLVHIGVCTGRFPNTGQPLPFVSYGGTNLLMNMFFIGVLLNISKERCGNYCPSEDVASEFDELECVHPTSRFRSV